MKRKLLAIAIPVLLVTGSTNCSIEIWRRLNKCKPSYYADYQLNKRDSLITDIGIPISANHEGWDGL